VDRCVNSVKKGFLVRCVQCNAQEGRAIHATGTERVPMECQELVCAPAIHPRPPGTGVATTARTAPWGILESIVMNPARCRTFCSVRVMVYVPMGSQEADGATALQMKSLDFGQERIAPDVPQGFGGVSARVYVLVWQVLLPLHAMVVDYVMTGHLVLATARASLASRGPNARSLAQNFKANLATIMECALPLQHPLENACATAPLSLDSGWDRHAKTALTDTGGSLATRFVLGMGIATIKAPVMTAWLEVAFVFASLAGRELIAM